MPNNTFYLYYKGTRQFANLSIFFLSRLRTRLFLWSVENRKVNPQQFKIDFYPFYRQDNIHKDCT